LKRAQTGKLPLDRDSVVVVYELWLLGTRQMLDLLRLQDGHGFRLVAVRGSKQCQSIEVRPVVDLLRQALGDGALPEILTTIRQQTQHEQEASLISARDARRRRWL
jgi:hypothetical protein